MKISKKIISLLAMGFLAVSCASSVTGNTSSITGMPGNRKETFACPGITDKVEVEYLKGGEKIRLTDSSGNVHELGLSKAASGSYYKNSKNSFHVKGDEAVLEINNITASCTRM